VVRRASVAARLLVELRVKLSIWLNQANNESSKAGVQCGAQRGFESRRSRLHQPLFRAPFGVTTAPLEGREVAGRGASAFSRSRERARGPVLVGLPWRQPSGPKSSPCECAARMDAIRGVVDRRWRAFRAMYSLGGPASRLDVRCCQRPRPRLLKHDDSLRV